MWAYKFYILLFYDKNVMMALLCMFERGGKGGRDSELCPASVYFDMSYVIWSRCQQS